jgi:hypothetical protein
MLTRTRIVHVQCAHVQQQAHSAVTAAAARPLAASVSSARRPPWSLLLCALLLLSSGWLLPLHVAAARSRARISPAPQLLHVRAQPLRLHSVLAAASGSGGGGPADLSQSHEQLLLLSLYFDRALPLHTLPANHSAMPASEQLLTAVECDGQTAMLQQWSLPPASLRWDTPPADSVETGARLLPLVTPVEAWMEHFEAEQR